MKAARFQGVNEPLAVEDVDVPDVGEDEALVRLEACGVCRSDWHVWQGDWGWLGMGAETGQILGHEPAGVVEEVGSKVERYETGDRVAIPFHLADGTCGECRDGNTNTCENGQVLGLMPGLNGAWAEYVRIPTADTNLVELPEGVAMEDMAGLGCRFMTAFHGVVHRGEVQPGDWVVVHGCGGVGLSAVQIASSVGANVIGVDIKPDKLEEAREQGAVETIDATEHSVADRVHEITGGGADVSLEALGASETIMNSIMSLRRHGRHVQIGLTTQEEEGMVMVPSDLMVSAEIDFRGSVGMQGNRYPEIFQMVSTGKIDPGAMVSDTISLNDVTDTLEGFTDYQTAGISVINQF